MGGTALQWLQPCHRPGGTLQCVLALWGPPSSPRAQGAPYLETGSLQVRSSYGPAHPGRGVGALTSKTRGKGEEERTGGQTGAREDSRDKPGHGRPQEPDEARAPQPPRALGCSPPVPGARSQGLQLCEGTRPAAAAARAPLASSPRCERRRPALPTTPQPGSRALKTLGHAWPADAQTTSGPGPSSVHGVCMWTERGQLPCTHTAWLYRASHGPRLRPPGPLSPHTPWLGNRPGWAAPVPHARQVRPERSPQLPPTPPGPRPLLHPPAGRPELREGLAEEAQRLPCGRPWRAHLQRAG